MGFLGLCVCRLSGGMDWGGGEMDGEEEGGEWLYELLTQVQLEQFYTKIRDDLQVTRSVDGLVVYLFIKGL